MKEQRTRSLAWKPPEYEVDDDGKVIGRTNTHELHNWGRWGHLDQRGATNFITPEGVVDAAKLVETGTVVSCAIPLDSKSPVHSSRTPIVHLFQYTGTDMVAGSEMNRRSGGYQGSDDYIVMPIQGSTQWDGLAHVGSDDMIYNGFWIGNVEAQLGAKRCGIHNLCDTLVGRGVLLDLPRYLGIDRLQPGRAITPQELDGCAGAEGVTLRTGDIVLIRTGHLPWYYALGRERDAFWRDGSPGLSMSCALWVAGRELAAVAMDNIGIEVEPFEESGRLYPLHVRLVRDLGVTLGEMWWLEDLAEACEANGRYEFFLSAPPLRISNGVGSMVNPVAVL